MTSAPITGGLSHHGIKKGHVLVSTGKKNKLRVYYLSWLRNRILHNDPEVEKKQGWITVGDLEGCIHYKVGKSRTKTRNIPRSLYY